MPVLANEMEKLDLWMRASNGENISRYAQQLIGNCRPRLCDLATAIATPLNIWPAQTKQDILGYIYQKCIHPRYGPQPVFYLRAVYFLENLLTDCFYRTQQLVSTGGWEQSYARQLSNQQTSSRTLPTSQAHQQVAPTRPHVKPCQPVNSNSNLNRMIGTFGAHRANSSQQNALNRPEINQQQNAPNQHQPQASYILQNILNQPLNNRQQNTSNLDQPSNNLQQNVFNSIPAAFNLQMESDQWQNPMLSPPMTPHVTEWPNVDTLSDWNALVAAAAVSLDEENSYENRSPSPPSFIDYSCLATMHLPGLQTPPPQQHTYSPAPNTPHESMRSSKNTVTQAQPQAIVNPHQHTIISPPMSPKIERHDQCVPSPVDEMAIFDSSFESEQFAAALDTVAIVSGATTTADASIETIPTQSEPIIDLSHLNIPVAAKIYYDMPALDDGLTGALPQQETSNAVVNTADDAPNEQYSRFPKDHFLLKQRNANRWRWPLSALDELEKCPRPKSLKNKRRTAKGMIDIESNISKQQQVAVAEDMDAVENEENNNETSDAKNNDCNDDNSSSFNFQREWHRLLPFVALKMKRI